MLVPLRSNGSGLLTGKPVDSVRRRLKHASLSFDRILLEAGVYRLQAGPGGSWAVHEPPPHAEEPRWQTPSRRHAAKATSFMLDMGRELTPGVLATATSTVLSSETEASWEATLYPFVHELPAGADWIEFTRTRDPAGSMKRLSDEWTWADKHNTALERVVPQQFLRAAVIGDANRDLAFAAEQEMAVSMDPLHAQVIGQRFNDLDGWAMRGFAVPILFPEVGDWPWDAVSDLRRDRNMARFRAILREVEQEAAAEAAAGGDVEAAAYRTYQRHLADAQEAVESIGAVAHTTLRAFVIGAIIGFAIVGIVGPLGVVAGAVAGAVPGAILDVRDVTRQRRTRGWVSVQQRIDRMRLSRVLLEARRRQIVGYGQGRGGRPGRAVRGRTIRCPCRAGEVKFGSGWSCPGGPDRPYAELAPYRHPASPADRSGPRALCQPGSGRIIGPRAMPERRSRTAGAVSVTTAGAVSSYADPAHSPAGDRLADLDRAPVGKQPAGSRILIR